MQADLPTSNTRVTVFGAYGHTGRFVAAELRRRGWTSVLSGRNRGKLLAEAERHSGIEVRVANVDDPVSLEAAISGSSAVINCAGPFLDTAVPIIEAAIRSGVHLDVAAEQAAVLGVFERYGADPPPGRSWTFPEPFGEQPVVPLSLAETITISRHLRTPEIRVFMNRAPLEDLRNPDTPPPAPADQSGRSSQIFVMDVVARRGRRERRVVARGQDIYAVTAPIVVEATERVVSGETRKTGVVAAGEAFDAHDFLKSLGRAQVQVEFLAG